MCPPRKRPSSWHGLQRGASQRRRRPRTRRTNNIPRTRGFGFRQAVGQAPCLVTLLTRRCFYLSRGGVMPSTVQFGLPQMVLGRYFIVALLKIELLAL